MMTKFNQEMYARIKAKKNEPLSNIGQRRVQVVQKETVEKISSTPTPDETRSASPAVSLEEITPHLKKCRTEDKGKEKVRASIWDDVGTALTIAYSIVMAEELKEISRVPSHEMVNRHIHKLVQVILRRPFSFSLSLSLSIYIYIYIYMYILTSFLYG